MAQGPQPRELLCVQTLLDSLVRYSHERKENLVSWLVPRCHGMTLMHSCSILVYAGGNTTAQGGIRREHTLPEETQECSDKCPPYMVREYWLFYC